VERKRRSRIAIPKALGKTAKKKEAIAKRRKRSKLGNRRGEESCFNLIKKGSGRKPVAENGGPSSHEKRCGSSK